MAQEDKLLVPFNFLYKIVFLLNKDKIQNYIQNYIITFMLARTINI